MPLVQLRTHHNREFTKFMSVPKKMAELQAWYKGAMKVIPEIPDPVTTDWQIAFQEANIKWIKFEVRHRKTEERQYIVIDRTVGALNA